MGRERGEEVGKTRKIEENKEGGGAGTERDVEGETERKIKREADICSEGGERGRDSFSFSGGEEGSSGNEGIGNLRRVFHA